MKDSWQLLHIAGSVVNLEFSLSYSPPTSCLVHFEQLRPVQTFPSGVQHAAADVMGRRKTPDLQLYFSSFVLI